ncbi:MAG: ssDNA-binding protein [Methylorubrum rhodinum]
MNLLKPGKKIKAKDKKEYDYWDVTFGWPKDADLTVLRNMVTEAAVAEWGEKARDWLKNGTIKTPFLDGDGPQGVSKKTGERYGGYEGHWFVRTGSYQKPGVFDRAAHPTDDPQVAYAGAYAYPVLNAYTWVDDKAGKGVTFGLSLVQFVKDGERLGGGAAQADPSKFFESIPDEGGAPAAAKEGQGAAALFS